MDTQHQAPELEACGWFVRTKRTAGDGAGWLIADCSSSPHGAEYARVFAAALVMRDALQVVLDKSELTTGVRVVVEEALAKAEGK